MAVINRDDVNHGVLDSETIDIAHYLGILKRYAFRIVSLAIAFTILVALLVMRMTPLYTSSTTILVDSENANVVSIQEVYGLDTKRKDYMQTQYEILRSRQIAERTVEGMNLHLNDKFMPPEEGPGIVDSLLDSAKDMLPFLPQEEVVERNEAQIIAAKKRSAVFRLMRAVEVSMVDNTQVMKISVTTESASLSAEIADTIADVYIEN